MPLTGGRYPAKNPAWLAAAQPSGVYRESFDRRLINTDLAALTTQVMSSVAISLQAGDVVTNITFKSGATAAGTPTNWWFALYDDSATPALLAQTADQLTAAWAANTAKTLALATAYTVNRPGIYYLGCMVKATTPPTLIGFTSFAGGVGGVLSTDKALSVTSGSSLTTTAPATIATPTTVATVPYAVVS
jgi:hypothetical protein